MGSPGRVPWGAQSTREVVVHGGWGAGIQRKAEAGQGAVTLHARPHLRFHVPREKDVARAVVQLFRAAGVWVGNTAQYRPSMVAIGLPDLICFTTRAMFWFECKRPQRQGYHPFQRDTWKSEPLRPDQQAFRDRCVAAGVRHYWGGVIEAEDALIDLGLATRLSSGALQIGRAA